MKREKVKVFYFSKNHTAIIQHLTYLRYNKEKKHKDIFVVKVEFLGPIQKEALELEIADLNELAAILQKDEEVNEWLESCAVAVNDTLVASLECPLKDGDKISLLPPVCGG